jgi:threonine/homoserine/homoserine lactone efflux protein
VIDIASTILYGLILGLSIAAPVGPIGILCIRRTIAQGKRAGFVSGLGAASADATYGALAALGVSVVTNMFVDLQDWMKVFGGLFLIYLGIKTFLARTIVEAGSSTTKDLVGNFLSTYLLTISNPMTILFFAAIFSGASVDKLAGQASSPIFVIVGVFMGSAAWWFILSQTAGAIKIWQTGQALTWINRISGSIIFGFGVAALASVVL